MNKKIALFVLISSLVPAFASAATNKTLASLIDLIITYANRILVLMMGVAVVMFVYHVIKYFIMADSERKEAGPYVMWSLIGFFVILSMWGLVNILQNTFGLQNDTNRPAGWNSFTNIFPGGGSSYNTNSQQYSAPIGPSGSQQYSAPIGPTGNQQYSAPIGPSNSQQYSAPIGPEDADGQTQDSMIDAFRGGHGSE